MVVLRLRKILPSRIMLSDQNGFSHAEPKTAQMAIAKKRNWAITITPVVMVALLGGLASE